MTWKNEPKTGSSVVKTSGSLWPNAPKFFEPFLAQPSKALRANSQTLCDCREFTVVLNGSNGVSHLRIRELVDHRCHSLRKFTVVNIILLRSRVDRCESLGADKGNSVRWGDTRGSGRFMDHPQDNLIEPCEKWTNTFVDELQTGRGKPFLKDQEGLLVEIGPKVVFQVMLPRNGLDCTRKGADRHFVKEQRFTQTMPRRHAAAISAIGQAPNSNEQIVRMARILEGDAVTNFGGIRCCVDLTFPDGDVRYQ